MTSSYLSLPGRTALLTAILALTTAALASAQHPAIYLLDVEGDIIDPINGENADAPFSTKMTCGMCHDYDVITEGYHFQMGWERDLRRLRRRGGSALEPVERLPGSLVPLRLPPAREEAQPVGRRDRPDRVRLRGLLVRRGQPPCGACHPGGGGFEFDRDGNRYDEHLAENPDLADIPGRRLPREPVGRERRRRGRLPDLPPRGLRLRGAGRPAHLGQLPVGGGGGIASRYRRAARWRRAHPDRASTRRASSTPTASITLDMSWPPPDENCVNCHGQSDVRKRGFSWNDPSTPTSTTPRA